MGRGVSSAVDQLCSPTDSAGAFDVLLPIVEKEDTVSDVAGRALDVMVGARVGFLHPEKVTGEAMPHTRKGRESRLVRCLSEEARPVRIIRVREYRRLDADGLECIKYAADTRVFPNKRGLTYSPDISRGVNALGGIGEQQEVPLAIYCARALPR